MDQRGFLEVTRCDLPPFPWRDSFAQGLGGLFQQGLTSLKPLQLLQEAQRHFRVNAGGRKINPLMGKYTEIDGILSKKHSFFLSILPRIMTMKLFSGSSQILELLWHITSGSPYHYNPGFSKDLFCAVNTFNFTIHLNLFGIFLNSSASKDTEHQNNVDFHGEKPLLDCGGKQNREPYRFQGHKSKAAPINFISSARSESCLLPSHVGYGDSQSFPHQWSFHNFSLGHTQAYSHLSSHFNLSFQSQDLSATQQFIADSYSDRIILDICALLVQWVGFSQRVQKLRERRMMIT